MKTVKRYYYKPSRYQIIARIINAALEGLIYPYEDKPHWRLFYIWADELEVYYPVLEFGQFEGSDYSWEQFDRMEFNDTDELIAYTLKVGKHAYSVRKSLRKK